MKDTFKYRVAQVLSGEYRSDDIVPVCSTPDVVHAVGIADCEIVMTQKHIRACLAPESDNKLEHNHDLPIDFMDNLPQYIESPAMILTSLSRPADSIVIVTDRKDKQDNPIIVALKNAGTGTVGGKVISCNIVTSTYGKSGFSGWLKQTLQQYGWLYCDIKKSRDLVVSAGLQLPGLLANHDSNTIIRRYNENVNSFKQKTLKNPKNYLPEKYGQTLYRPDGLPFAYVDEDGRQRLTEYGKKADGTPYVTKTSATFSDGCSEITEYGADGKVLGIERFAADGRETYSYSSDGCFRMSERSVEYASDDDYFARKSVHGKTRNKKEERGVYFDDTKESWEEYDERGNIVLLKQNSYGDGEKLSRASESSYTYDGYGNMLTCIAKDGSVKKLEYYPPTKVRDYFGYTADDYDAGVVDHDRLKTVTSKYSDGSMRVLSYSLEGKYTQSDYSPGGELTMFRNENGESFQGKAAARALLKSSGQELPKSETKSAVASRSSKQAQGTTVTKTVTKTVTAAKAPNGKSSGGRGGAGR